MGMLDIVAGRPAATPHAEAVERGADGIAIYWRAGCPFCARMRIALRGDADAVAWVNIWEDPDGAAYVRSVNDGNETVPTVVIAGQAHTNPSPSLVRQALRDRR